MSMFLMSTCWCEADAHLNCRCMLHALDTHTSSVSHVYVIDPKSVKKEDLYGTFGCNFRICNSFVPQANWILTLVNGATAFSQLYFGAYQHHPLRRTDIGSFLTET